MTDYSQHRPPDWEWYHAYRSRMGAEAFGKYLNDVYRMLSGMKPGSFFSIEKNVRSENIDLFIKICCMFIDEQVRAGPADVCHCFNPDYSIIKCQNKICTSQTTTRTKSSVGRKGG